MKNPDGREPSAPLVWKCTLRHIVSSFFIWKHFVRGQEKKIKDMFERALEKGRYNVFFVIYKEIKYYLYKLVTFFKY